MGGYKFFVCICVETNVSGLFEGNISKFSRTGWKMELWCWFHFEENWW